MWIVCIADNSQEISGLIFSENIKSISDCCLLQFALCRALWVNYCPYIDKSWPLDHEKIKIQSHEQIKLI